MLNPAPEYKGLNNFWKKNNSVLVLLFFWIALILGSVELKDNILRLLAIQNGEKITARVIDVEIEKHYGRRNYVYYTTLIDFDSFDPRDKMKERRLTLDHEKLDTIHEGDQLPLRYDKKHGLFTLPDKAIDYKQIAISLLIFLFGAIPLGHYYFVYKPTQKRTNK